MVRGATTLSVEHVLLQRGHRYGWSLVRLNVYLSDLSLGIVLHQPCAMLSSLRHACVGICRAYQTVRLGERVLEDFYLLTHTFTNAD